MERRYLSMELINSLDFEKRTSLNKRYDTNIFSKETDCNYRKYIRIAQLYVNKDVAKVYFNDLDNYHVNQWNKRNALCGKPSQDIDSISKEVATTCSFVVTLYCYEDGEVIITFRRDGYYCLDDDEFRLVGDNVPLLLNKVKEYAKKKSNIDFEFTKGYTIFDGVRYIKSFDDFDLLQNNFLDYETRNYLEELKNLDVNFDEFVEYLITEQRFIRDVFRKFVIIEEDFYGWSCIKDSVDFFKKRKLAKD